MLGWMLRITKKKRRKERGINSSKKYMYILDIQRESGIRFDLVPSGFIRFHQLILMSIMSLGHGFCVIF